MKQILFILAFIWAGSCSQYALAQKCPNGQYRFVALSSKAPVAIYACIEKAPSLDVQLVLWGVRNLTADKLEVKFTQVVHLVCGNVLRESASVIIKGDAFMGGGAIQGDDISLSTQVWGEHCNRRDNRILNVAFENLTIENLSQREREIQLKEERAQREKEAEEAAERQREEEAGKARARADSIEQANTAAKQKEAEAEQEKEADDEKKGEKTTANRPKSAEELSWEERYNRVNLHQENQRQKANQANAAISSTVELMVATTDNSVVLDRRTYFKLGLYLGLNNIPAYMNTTSSEVDFLNRATTDVNTPTISELELQAVLYRWKSGYFSITPYFQYGLSYIGGNNGDHLSYGGTAQLTIGRKVRIYSLLTYEWRLGSNTYDHDAALDNVGYVLNTKAVGRLSYNYAVISYGGGLLLDTNKKKQARDPEDKFLQLGLIVHQPNFIDGNLNPPPRWLPGGQFKWVIGGGFSISAEYVPRYPVAGEVQQVLNEYENKTFWLVKLGKVFNL
ncbi:hypothetical protein ACWKWU_10745 [Chitinophaga lutea]